MARKSKRLVLNEAIRQGQAKIAEGLKTGQMRSDGPPNRVDTGGKESFSRANENALRPEKMWSESFRSKKKSKTTGIMAPRNKSAVLLYAGAVVVLGFGIWFIMTLFMDSGESTPVNPESKAEVQGTYRSTDTAKIEVTDSPDTTKRSSELSGIKRPETSETRNTVDTVDSPLPNPAAAADGDNVIWIQSIDLKRKDELAPLAEFFMRKGIETEIVVHRDSGDAILVTKDGFVENPRKSGTEGYKLLQLIKRLGPVYVEETKDTKFGVKPFQDVLGYKR